MQCCMDAWLLLHWQDDDDEGGEDDDEDDGFFVPHGYLSDGEGAPEDEVHLLKAVVDLLVVLSLCRCACWDMAMCRESNKYNG